MRVLHVTEAAASGTLEVVRVLSASLVADGHAVALAYGTRPETPADILDVLPAGLDSAVRIYSQGRLGVDLAAVDD